jgi:hypothetical protein
LPFFVVVFYLLALLCGMFVQTRNAFFVYYYKSYIQ